MSEVNSESIYSKIKSCKTLDELKCLHKVELAEYSRKVQRLDEIYDLIKELKEERRVLDKDIGYGYDPESAILTRAGEIALEVDDPVGFEDC